MGFVLGRAWRRAGVLTDAELAELRYGTRLAPVLRGVKAVYFGTVFNCTVLAMVLFAATRIAEPFLRWDAWLPETFFAAVVDLVRALDLSLSSRADPVAWAQHSASNALSLLAIVVATAFYSTTGGLRAVVNTDLVQFGIAMLATALYAAVIVGQVGGLERIPGELEALYGATFALETLAFTPSLARDASWVVLGTLAIQWFAQMNADGTGYLAQRTMACRSDRDARQAAVVFTFAQILLRSLFWIPIGLGLLILIPLEPGAAGVALREATFVEGMARYLPAGALGLMLTGLLAALASTVDTHLNWGASYWTNDLYGRLLCRTCLGVEPSRRSLVLVARISNLVILAIAVAILTRLDSIRSAWETSLLLGAGMGVPLILRWLWWRVTAGAELAAILVSSVLAPVLLAYVPVEGSRMLLMTLATTVTAVAVSLVSQTDPNGAAQAFYLRVRPPGFWGPIARACGETPAAARERLGTDLATTVATALGIFCLLVGIGTWLFGSPAPAWFPWRGPWIAALFAAGALALAGPAWRERRKPRTHGAFLHACAAQDLIEPRRNVGHLLKP